MTTMMEHYQVPVLPDTDTDTFMRAAVSCTSHSVNYTTTVNYTVTNALKDMTYGPLCGGRPLRELQPTTPLHVAYSRTYWTRSDARLLPSRELGLESRDSPADQEGPKSGYALE